MHQQKEEAKNLLLFTFRGKHRKDSHGIKVGQGLHVTKTQEEEKGRKRTCEGSRHLQDIFRSQRKRRIDKEDEGGSNRFFPETKIDKRRVCETRRGRMAKHDRFPSNFFLIHRKDKKRLPLKLLSHDHHRHHHHQRQQKHHHGMLLQSSREDQ